MDSFWIAVWIIALACILSAIWANVTSPNLRCRWLGHAIVIRDGWAYCARCAWREPLPPLPPEGG